MVPALRHVRVKGRYGNSKATVKRRQKSSLPALRAGKVPAAPSHMLRFASQNVDLRWAAAYPKLDPSAPLEGRET